MAHLQSSEIVILIGVAVGMLAFWFALWRPALRKAAEQGARWGVPPVLRACCERALDLKRAELQRLLTRARTRQRAKPAPLAAARIPVLPPGRTSQPAPTPVGVDALMPGYRGRASLSVLGPAGELFLHLERPLTDRQGGTHHDVATTAIIPPDARGFVEQAIADDRWLLISCIAANAYEARLRVTVEEADGRLVPLREWVLEQAVAWQPLPGPQVQESTPERIRFTLQRPFSMN